MPGWEDIYKEISTTKPPIDTVRRKYLTRLSKMTNRNVIAYYSSFLDKKDVANLDINDQDMNGFMNAIKGMECSKGLDLILHTPGGSPTAAEAIVKYLRKKFSGNIRVIVPQMAMSAGTMLACAAKEIIMGNQSSLGPVDPQFSGIPAYSIAQEFEEAKIDLATHPEHTAYWAIKLQQYPAAFLKTALDAIDLSSVLIKEWLSTGMFTQAESDIVDNIVSKLNEHDDSKFHGRHYNIDFCKNIGLKVQALEDNDHLQDVVLSIHHAYILTLSATDVSKIIESHQGRAFITHARSINVT